MSKEEKEALEVTIDKLGVSLSKKIDDLSQKLEEKIDRKIASIRYWGIGGVTVFCIVFSWIFDYKVDFTNDKNQAQFEKLEAAVFITRQDAIMKAIQELRNQLEKRDRNRKKESKKRIKKR